VTHGRKYNALCAERSSEWLHSSQEKRATDVFLFGGTRSVWRNKGKKLVRGWGENGQLQRQMPSIVIYWFKSFTFDTQEIFLEILQCRSRLFAPALFTPERELLLPASQLHALGQLTACFNGYLQWMSGNGTPKSISQYQRPSSLRSSSLTHTHSLNVTMHVGACLRVGGHIARWPLCFRSG
jgi:hypothetical protein